MISDEERVKRMIARFLAGENSKSPTKKANLKKNKTPTKKANLKKNKTPTKKENLKITEQKRAQQMIARFLAETPTSKTQPRTTRNQQVMARYLAQRKKCPPDEVKKVAKKIRDLVPTIADIKKMTPTKFKHLREEMMKALDGIAYFGEKCIDGFHYEPTIPSIVPGVGPILPIRNILPSHLDVFGDDPVSAADFERAVARLKTSTSKKPVARTSKKKKKRIAPTLVS